MNELALERTSSHTPGPLPGARLARFGRAALVAIALALAFTLAWLLASEFLSFVLIVQPSFSRGVAFGSILSLAMFCLAHLGKLLTLLGEAYRWINDPKTVDAAAVPNKASRLIVDAFLIAFPVALASMTIASTPVDGADEPRLQFVHGILHGEMKESYSIYLPYLVFKQGSLKDPGIPLFGQESAVDPGVFNQEGFTISSTQEERLAQFVGSLAMDCSATDISPLSIEVLGFASNAPFVDQSKKPRDDSKLLNRHLANLRAQSAKSSIVNALSDNPALQAAITVEPRTWESFDEMAAYRDGSAFRTFRFALSEYTDHRSAMLDIKEPYRCSFMPGNQWGEPFRTAMQ